MKKFLITWWDGERCKEAKIYAHDSEEAVEIAKQFVNDASMVVSEL